MKTNDKIMKPIHNAEGSGITVCTIVGAINMKRTLIVLLALFLGGAQLFSQVSKVGTTAARSCLSM